MSVRSLLLCRMEGEEKMKTRIEVERGVDMLSRGPYICE
jgi:hypothetical protein